MPKQKSWTINVKRAYARVLHLSKSNYRTICYVRYLIKILKMQVRVKCHNSDTQRLCLKTTVNNT